ncbi:hypothetical protein Y032_0103g3543 [Ancylostoma ceylanicum]|uniref:Uncharacterized protein n=1 Tax=Ancylostoma ceylanicum TaxID=53326 RepID=A0A016TGZ0_9BILA|nr:hypothetical protein Y032_0103g3543 [Ancylostoma ceylanicum]
MDLAAFMSDMKFNIHEKVQKYRIKAGRSTMRQFDVLNCPSPDKMWLEPKMPQTPRTPPPPPPQQQQQQQRLQPAPTQLLQAVEILP